MLERVRRWLSRRTGTERAPAPPAGEGRASGEEALESADEEAAEGTPSGMPRVKTDRL